VAKTSGIDDGFAPRALRSANPKSIGDTDRTLQSSRRSRTTISSDLAAVNANLVVPSMCDHRRGSTTDHPNDGTSPMRKILIVLLAVVAASIATIMLWRRSGRPFNVTLDSFRQFGSRAAVS
jgi:hypothetical protein